MKKKTFEYQLGDPMILYGLKVEVVYTNHGHAWVAPLKERPDLGLYRGCVCGKFDEYGKPTRLG